MMSLTNTLAILSGAVTVMAEVVTDGLINRFTDLVVGATVIVGFAVMGDILVGAIVNADEASIVVTALSVPLPPYSSQTVQHHQ